MSEVTISRKLCGGMIDFVIYDAPEDMLEGIIDEVYAEALRLQKIFNFYDAESELSLLNKSRKLIVSNELLHVIKNALVFSKLTNGAYDVTLGKAILARKQGKIITAKCTYKDVLTKGNEITLLNPEVMIDLGSIAKGYIADKLAELMQTNGIVEFLIDARGDICARGERTHVLEIQHPRNGGSICAIKLKNCAVATSGDYKQYAKDFETSHIINQTDLVSVTVVAKTVEEADAYATAIFTCPPKDRKEVINSNKNIKVLIVEKNNLKIQMFNGFETIINGEAKWK